jgi:PPOX class probable F420-dependent enzyme
LRIRPSEDGEKNSPGNGCKEGLWIVDLHKLLRKVEGHMTAFPESHTDLLQTDVAILATVGKDGYPQVTAVWFLLDEDGLVKLSLNTGRQKVRNLQAHRECALFILDRANPSRTLEIRAQAEIAPDQEYAFADKLGRKYGTDLRKIDRPGESRIVVTLRPVKINAIDLSKR